MFRFTPPHPRCGRHGAGTNRPAPAYGKPPPLHRRARPFLYVCGPDFRGRGHQAMGGRIIRLRPHGDALQRPRHPHQVSRGHRHRAGQPRPRRQSARSCLQHRRRPRGARESDLRTQQLRQIHRRRTRVGKLVGLFTLRPPRGNHLQAGRSRPRGFGARPHGLHRRGHQPHPRPSASGTRHAR